MKNFKKILKIYIKYISNIKAPYFIALILVILMAIFNVYLPIAFGNLVESFTNGTQTLWFLVIPLAIFFLEKVVYSVRNWFGDKVTFKVLWQETVIDYMAKLLHVDYAFHMNKSSGSLISVNKRMQDVFFELFWGINLWVLTILLEFTMSIYYLFRADALMGTIMLGTLFFSLLASYPIVKKSLKLRKKSNDSDDKVSGVFVDNMTGFETVKIFGQEKVEVGRLKYLFKDWEKTHLKSVFAFRQIDLIVYTILFIGSVWMMYIAYMKVNDGLWGVGMLITVFTYVQALNWKSFELLFKYRKMLKLGIDIQKYLDIMEVENKVKEKKNPVELNKVRGDIEFKNLTFSYDDTKEDGKKVLYDINLNINQDETIAFVGKSGSGKTTLTKLLLRFYDPDMGSISLDGHDLKDVKLEDLRKSIGLVPQDPVMFNETIKYNVAYGKQDATMEEIESAMERASLDVFVDSLPKGYDTIVGERGIKLSGGQRQRLAIARIMLSDPEIVIFDEATSQLDSENEKNIQEAFDNLTRRKTTIIIAHRLSTVMNADRIVVFDDGEIEEIGSHEELMRSGGIYSTLWKLQTEVLG